MLNPPTVVTGATAVTDTITVTHSLAVNDKIYFTDVGTSTAIETGKLYWVKSVNGTTSFTIVGTYDLTLAAINIKPTGSATLDFYKTNRTQDYGLNLTNTTDGSVYDNDLADNAVGRYVENGTRTYRLFRDTTSPCSATALAPRLLHQRRGRPATGDPLPVQRRRPVAALHRLRR